MKNFTIFCVLATIIFILWIAKVIQKTLKTTDYKLTVLESQLVALKSMDITATVVDTDSRFKPIYANFKLSVDVKERLRRHLIEQVEYQIFVLKKSQKEDE